MIIKTDKPLVRIIKEKLRKLYIANIMYEKGKITTDPINIEKIMRGYYKNCAYLYKNLHYFPEKYKKKVEGRNRNFIQSSIYLRNLISNLKTLHKHTE